MIRETSGMRGPVGLMGPSGGEGPAVAAEVLMPEVLPETCIPERLKVEPASGPKG